MLKKVLKLKGRYYDVYQHSKGQYAGLRGGDTGGIDVYRRRRVHEGPFL